MINFILWFLTIFVILRNIVGVVTFVAHPLSAHPGVRYRWDVLDFLGLLAIIGLFIRYW